MYFTGSGRMRHHNVCCDEDLIMHLINFRPIIQTNPVIPTFLYFNKKAASLRIQPFSISSIY